MGNLNSEPDEGPYRIDVSGILRCVSTGTSQCMFPFRSFLATPLPGRSQVARTLPRFAQQVVVIASGDQSQRTGARRPANTPPPKASPLADINAIRQFTPEAEHPALQNLR